MIAWVDYFSSFSRSSHRHARGEKKEKMLFFHLIFQSSLWLKRKNKKPGKRGVKGIKACLGRKETSAKVIAWVDYFSSFYRSSHRHARGEKKEKMFFHLITHVSRFAQKTPMTVAIPPVVQVIERQETRDKTRLFSETQKILHLKIRGLRLVSIWSQTIADRRSQKLLRSSAIIWKHTSAIACDPAIVIADDRKR